MNTKIFFTLVSLLFLTAKGDPDPQTFIASTPGPLFPSPSQQPQYEERNVVVYLTPEQISALRSGQGVLEPVFESQSEQEDKQQDQEQTSQYDLEQGFDQSINEQNEFLGNQRFVIVQNQEEKEPAPVKEPNQEEPRGLSRYTSAGYKYKTSDSERNKYYAPTVKRLENNRYIPSTEKPEGRKYDAPSTEKPEELDLKSYNYYSVYNEKRGDNINIKIVHPNAKLREILGLKELETQRFPALNKKYKFLPYAYVNKKLSNVAPVEESNQSSPSSQKNNERQYAVLFNPSKSEEKQESQEYEQEDSIENEQNADEDLNESSYESRQNERRKILDLLRKQNAQAEAANSGKLPVVIKKPSITKQAAVPKSYIIRVQQSDEVKVRQPYSVPLEIIRRIPIEIENAEKELERQTYKAENPVRVPTTKKVYVKVDKPILVERIVPVETRREVKVKPQKLTILGPTLKYFD